VWDPTSKKVVFETPGDVWEQASAITPALASNGLLAVGRHLYAKAKGSKPESDVLLYQTRTGTLLHRLDPGKGLLVALAVSNDGKLVAWETSEAEAVIAEAATGNVLRRVSVPRSAPEPTRRYVLVFSPAGDQLAIGLGSKGTMLVPCAADGEAR